MALITKTEEAADLMPREQVDMARVVADAQEDLHEMFDLVNQSVVVKVDQTSILKVNQITKSCVSAKAS